MQAMGKRYEYMDGSTKSKEDRRGAIVRFHYDQIPQ